MGNPLRELWEVGQSFWIDNLTRSMITTGELERLILEDGLRGLTSNPTIFQKALSSSEEYDLEITRLNALGHNAAEIFETLAIHDIRAAANLFRPIFDGSDGLDGYVSLELPPRLAYDTEGSIQEARRLFRAVGRPNVMIKVPGTPAGLPAIEQLIADGVNVNITLLFALDNYEQVMEAYLRGIERRAQAGLPANRIASVASFFVSRVDTEVDRRLDEMLARASDEDERRRLASLKGKVAVANARIAYQRFKRVFLEGERFARLRERYGANIQRPLWASTSTKNPAYSDVLYIEELIGPHTVQTMAPVSIEAFRDHGTVRVSVEENLDDAYRTLELLADVGISYDDVTSLLQEQGVDLFAQSYDSLIDGIEAKRAELATRPEPEDLLGIYGPEVEAAARDLANRDVIGRLWRRDASLWSHDPSVQARIADRLGWLDVPYTMREHVDGLADLQADMRAAGFTKAVLLGMGGSSLAPEVLQSIVGSANGFPDLVVLDSTNPDTIARVEASLDLSRTLFIVSSKSGTTIETSTLFAYFYERVETVDREAPGRHFIAITDPGTPLEEEARARGFRHVFLNPPDIGGRYSALSYFGLVPAAVIGIDPRPLLDGAVRMAEQVKQPGPDNPALWLGAAIGTLAQLDRDKLTFITDPALDSLADWLEQLIAECTGKGNVGIVPVAHEPHGPVAAYGGDRVFVGIDLVPQPHSETDAVLAGLLTAGHPAIRLRLADRTDIAAEFFRWEVATAVAGVVLRINPFDEPNVQESKDITSRLLTRFAREHELGEPAPAVATPLTAAFDTTAPSIDEALAAFLTAADPGDYLAILAFADRRPEIQVRLDALRALLLQRLRVATTLGYGPRYLHSIGQLYKGGPRTGAFLQIVAAPEVDRAIPDRPYTFETLFRAQSLGDYEALRARRVPVLRLLVRDDPVAGLDQILQIVTTVTLR